MLERHAAAENERHLRSKGGALRSGLAEQSRIIKELRDKFNALRGTECLRLGKDDDDHQKSRKDKKEKEDKSKRRVTRVPWDAQRSEH